MMEKSVPHKNAVNASARAFDGGGGNAPSPVVLSSKIPTYKGDPSVLDGLGEVISGGFSLAKQFGLTRPDPSPTDRSFAAEIAPGEHAYDQRAQATFDLNGPTMQIALALGAVGLLLFLKD